MIKKVLSGTINGFLAGICIAMGGSIFVACDNKYIGAFLFCVALMTICNMGFALFTGKIGLIVKSHTKDDIIVLLTSLLGNFLSCLVFGLLIKSALPALFEKSAEIAQNKLSQTPVQTILRAVMCGILMYIAVWIYQNKNSNIGILFCIPTFILAGFEHSIADMFYFSLGTVFSKEAVLFVFLVVLGNALGAVILPLLIKARDCLNN